MSILQGIILGIVQGLTEFLPVSSSGHLVLVPWWLGWDSPGLAFDTLLHWGTLLALLVYFWRDWWEMAVAAVKRLRGQPTDGKDRLLLAIVVGTIPAAVIGYLFQSTFESLFSSPTAAAIFLIVTGLLLVFAERWRRGDLSLEQLGLPDAVFIGVAQALAIAPGLSRSGTTIAAGLVRRFDRTSAARFSFLLGTPVFFGAGLLKLKDLLAENSVTSNPQPLVLGALAAAVVGFLSIRFLLGYIQKHSLNVFAYWVWAFAALTLLRVILM